MRLLIAPVCAAAKLACCVALFLAPSDRASAIRWSFNDSAAAAEANFTGVIAGGTVATCGACTFYTDFAGRLVRVPAEPTDCGVESVDPTKAIPPCAELDLSAAATSGAYGDQASLVYSFDEEVFRGMTSLASLNLGTEYPIKKLPKSLFNGLTSLKSLQFSFPALASIPEGLFSQANLTSLEFLGLRECSLTTIPTGSFANLSSLEYLSLRSNGITEVPAGLFDGLTKLRELDLMSNLVRSLPEGIFDDLTQLEYLRAPNNNLESMPKQVFKNLGALTWLGLKANLFSDVPADFLTGLSSLRVLDLSDCWPLQTLPSGFFEPAPSIRALYLARANLMSLPDQIWEPLMDLRVMNLEGNPGFCYPTPLPDTFPKTMHDVDDSIFSEQFPYPLDEAHSAALSQESVGAPPCRNASEFFSLTEPPADGGTVDTLPGQGTDESLPAIDPFVCNCQCSAANASAPLAAPIVGTVEVEVVAGSSPRCWCLATCTSTCNDLAQDFHSVGPCT